MGSLANSARRFSYLVRLEAREARATYSAVLEIGLLVALGMAWWTYRSGGEVSLGWTESIGFAGLVQILLIPLLGDVFSANDERAAQRVVASLPVASGLVFVARWVVVLGAALTLYAGLVLAWAGLAAFAPAATEPTASADGPWGAIAAWLL
ncbi:MAG: hypothetical protein ACJAQ3_002388, partial [Planctomycetota bacterium]